MDAVKAKGYTIEESCMMLDDETGLFSADMLIALQPRAVPWLEAGSGGTDPLLREPGEAQAHEDLHLGGGLPSLLERTGRPHHGALCASLMAT